MNTYEPTFIVEIDGKQLPEDISQHVENFSYEDHDEKMDELRITVADAHMQYIDHPQLQEGKEVRARWGYVGNLSPIRTCTIKEISYSFPENGNPMITVTAFDKSHKLTGRSVRTCWCNKKVKDVVEDVAKKHNLKPVVEIPNDITREFISEGSKNDMIFLNELAADTGCLMWVENDELHFKPNTVTPPVMKFRYREDQDGYLISLSVKSNAEKGKGTGCGTEMTGIDPLAKKEFAETTTAPELGVKTNMENGVTENETPHQQNADENGRVVPTPKPTQTHAKQEGEGKVQKDGMKAVEATARTIGLPTLRAKDSVTIENIGKKFSGNWRVKRVKHQISRSGYVCDLTLVKSDHEGKASGAASKQQTSSTPAGQSKNTAPPTVAVSMKTGETF